MAYEYSELLRLIKNKYGTRDNFAKALGIGRVSLSLRLNNRLEFTQDEIVKAAVILDIPVKMIPVYFFCTKSSETRTK